MLTKFNISLENLPEHAIVVDRLSDLEEIISDEFNLVIFSREYCERRANFARFMASYLPSSEDSLLQFLNSLPEHSQKKRFIKEYTQLSEIIDKLQDETRTVFQPTNHKHNGSWHQDPGFTINYTLVGQGGLWSPNDNIRNGEPIDFTQIRQFGTQHIAIYKGKGEDNPAGPLYHSPPIRTSPEERILMQLYL